MRRIDLIPYACGAGARSTGSAQGPTVLQKLKIENALAADGFEAAWLDFYQSPAEMPDIKAGSPQAYKLVLDHVDNLCKQVSRSALAGHLPISIGGDHSMAIGSVAGIAKAYDAYGKIGLLWIDAHMDLHTPETSPTKNIHGMPVAHLLGLGDKNLSEIGGKATKINPENICMIGIRDFEEAEKKRVADMGIKVFYADDINAMGIEKVMEQAGEIITRGTKVQYLSFDIDGVDPEITPAVGTPVENGLTEEDFSYILDFLSENISLAGMDIAEYDPSLDRQGKTASFLYRMLPKMVAQEKKIASTLTMRNVVGQSGF